MAAGLTLCFSFGGKSRLCTEGRREVALSWHKKQLLTSACHVALILVVLILGSDEDIWWAFCFESWGRLLGSGSGSGFARSWKTCKKERHIVGIGWLLLKITGKC